MSTVTVYKRRETDFPRDRSFKEPNFRLVLFYDLFNCGGPRRESVTLCRQPLSYGIVGTGVPLVETLIKKCQGVSKDL